MTDPIVNAYLAINKPSWAHSVAPKVLSWLRKQKSEVPLVENEKVWEAAKIVTIAGVLGTILVFGFAKVAKAETDEQIADAIYKAENSVRYPYGIKSIDTKGNKEYARKICLNTIRNNRKRFAKQTKYKDFISFLGSRYCPTTIKSEYSLNKNWVRNVNFYLARAK